MTSTTAVTLGAMIAEIRENNISKGWRSAAGGPGSNTFGDYIALLNTEVSEAVEAYRTHRLDDATGPDRAARAKPEGVGSEMADVLIRLLDTADVFGLNMVDPDLELGDIAPLNPAVSDPELPELVTFGEHMAWLSRRIDRMWATSTTYAPVWALRALVTVAEKYDIDLAAEYARKMAYNRTRPFRHGGRALSDTNA